MTSERLLTRRKFRSLGHHSLAFYFRSGCMVGAGALGEFSHGILSLDDLAAADENGGYECDQADGDQRRGADRYPRLERTAIAAVVGMDGSRIGIWTASLASSTKSGES